MCASAVSGHLNPSLDLAHRVPELRRKELVLLASIGALNSIGCAREEDLPADLNSARKTGSRQRLHRRDALWQVERAVRFAGPLLEGIPESDTASPLAPMTAEERLVADFRGAGLTVGPHPMAYRRAALRRARVLSAQELTQVDARPICAHGRLRDCAAEARYGQRLRLPQPRR